ncbi:MAG: SDR family oxidoreductase [Spirochaetes bacterium]|nr:SDR family oxidoreductase [Spirochaetota bacterium]
MKNQAVLITGGTKGIGYATACQFAKAGARLYMTYKWGSANNDKIYDDFKKNKFASPTLIEADVSVDEDTDKLLDEISKKEKKVDIFISNVGFAQRTMSLEEYKKKSLFKTLEYSTWPMIEYSRKIKKKFGSYPKYIIGVSSDGPDHFYQGYDFVAASKALLEFFGKYLSVHLFQEGSRVNILRFGTVKTESFQLIFGEEFFKYLKKNGVNEEYILKPEDCARAILCLCSGLMDAVNGQIITADHGFPIRDNIMMRYLSQNKVKKK